MQIWLRRRPAVASAEVSAEFSTRMLNAHPALLEQMEQQLTTNGWGKLALNRASIQQGLKLVSEAEVHNANAGGSFYQFDGNQGASVANSYLSYPAAWGILGNTLQTWARTDQLPVKYFRINHPDLSLSDEQKARLEANGITRLPVRIHQAGDQLIRFTEGAGISLYQRRSYYSYRIEPVTIGNETLTFSDAEVENVEYVWGHSLYPNSLQPRDTDIAGVWLMPVYEAHDDGDRSQFRNSYLDFHVDGTGINRDTGESFSWKFAFNIQGQPALLMNFSPEQTQVFRLLRQTQHDYMVDSFVHSRSGDWVAATTGIIAKQ